MTASEVVIVGPQWDGRTPGPGVWTLWYFGSSYARYLELTAKAGQYRVAPVGEAINAIAERIRNEIIELDANLASGCFPLSWLASDLAERNPFTSDFYLDLCRGIALVEAACGRDRHLVIVEDPSLGRALVKICHAAGIRARWRGDGAKPLRVLLSSLRRHASFLRGWFAQRRVLAQQRIDPRTLVECDVCLLTWYDGKRFAADGSQPDRFLGPLPGWLLSDGVRIGWLGNAVGWMTPIADIAAAAKHLSKKEPFALVAMYQNFTALLRAYCHLFAFPLALHRHLTIGGVDVTALLRRVVLLEIASPRLVFAALFAGLADGLKRYGLAPRALFYTYENQPWEKAMLSGFRRALPATRLIGVQHAALAEYVLSVHPSRRQWCAGTAPDVLLTIGEDFHKRLLALGAPAERIQTGGALRYLEILSQRIARRASGPDGPWLVLATCPMDQRDAQELVHKAASATAKMKDVRLLVNFHPFVNQTFRGAVIDMVAKVPDGRHVEFVEGGVQRWLGGADVLLYNSSSTAFDAAAFGVPPVHVGSDIALDMNAMPGPGVLRCRHIEDLRNCIETLLYDPEYRRVCVKAARSYLHRCCVVPNADFWVGLARQAVDAKI